VDDKSGQIVYTRRVMGKRFRPKVFSRNSHTVKIGDPDSDRWQTLKAEPATNKTVKVVFD